MKKEPKIIIELTKLVRPLFNSDKEWEDFLYSPEVISDYHMPKMTGLEFIQ